MDWSKAKNIIIVALLLTNMFLIITYGVNVRDRNGAELAQEQETLSLLMKRNIFLNCELPENQGRQPVLTVGYASADEAALQEQLRMQEPLPLSARTQEELIAMAQDFLERSGYWNENVVLHKAEAQGTELHLSYRNIVEEFPLEESYINCIVKDGVVISVDRYWLSARAFGRAKQETISPTVALILFMGEVQRETQDSITIDSIEMVYWLDAEAIDTEAPVYDTARPAWKITYNDGQVFRVHAYEE